MNNARPTERDPEVIELAVQKILPEVVRWCRAGGDTCQESEIADDLRKEIGSHSDGYEFCRELEKHYHWTCDSELVDILDNASMSDAVRSMERKWVAAYRVYPGQLPGNAVQYGGKACTILRSYDDGHYVINSPLDGQKPTEGWVVAWEVIDGQVNMLGLTVDGPLFGAVA